MSRRSQYDVAGHLFQTQSAVVQHIRTLVAGYTDGERLSSDDLAFMLDILTRHPSAQQKMGAGVATMEVRRNPVYPAQRGFWLIRHDGSETDFSWVECLRETSHAKRFLRALRVAIEPDIRAYRQAFFAARHGMPYRCPYTGEVVTKKDSHVDHKPPLTFQALAQQFIDMEEIDVMQVQVNGKATDNVLQDTLADQGLTQRWVHYHRSYAQLQIVSRTANLSIIKKTAKAVPHA